MAGAFLGGPGTTGKGARLGKAASADRLEFTLGPHTVCGYLQGAFRQVVCEFSVLPRQRNPVLVLPSEQVAEGGSSEPPADPLAAASLSGTQADGVRLSQVQTPRASAGWWGLLLAYWKLCDDVTCDDVYADAVRYCFIASCFRKQSQILFPF